MKSLASLGELESTTLELQSYIIILALSFILSFVLAWFIGSQSRVKSSAARYKYVFPVLIPVMVLIISVIKSSVALSLGLVGALSIVRFRTPVKEAEELVYIFMAIAVGIGLGANYIMTTIVTFLLILIVLKIAFTIYKKNETGDGYFLELNMIDGKLDPKAVTSELSKVTENYSLKRIESGSMKICSFFISDLSDEKATELLSKLEKKFSSANILMFKNSEDVA